jgi:hypothetical protein
VRYGFGRAGTWNRRFSHDCPLTTLAVNSSDNLIHSPLPSRNRKFRTCHHTEVPLPALRQMIIQDFHWRGCYVELIGLGSACLWVRRGRGCRPSRTPDGMGTGDRDSSRKGTSTQCAGEVPTQGAGTAGTKADTATATIAVVSEAADTDGTDAASVGGVDGAER